MQNKHIIELDSWRGIMAMLVAIFHYTVPNNFVSAELAVDFFFILSGIVLQKSYFKRDINVIEFFKKRLYRLYPLHLFALSVLLFLFLGTVFFIHYPKTGSLLQAINWQFPPDYYKDGIFFTFIQQLIFINGLGFHPSHQYWNGAAWSVSVELWVNLIFFIWLRKYSTPLLILISFFIYSIIFVNFGRLGVHNEYVMYINSGFLRCLAGFGLGVVIYRWLEPIMSSTISRNSLFYSLLQIISCVVLFYIMFSNQHNYNDFLALLFILIIISVSLLQLNTPLNNILRLKLFVFIGKISYSIYLMHYSVQYIMQSILNMRFSYSLNGYINILLFVISVIFLSGVSYFLIERNSKSIMNKISSMFVLTK